MNMKDVKEFIKLAKDEGVASLKYEKDDVKIAVTLPIAGDVAGVAPIRTQIAAPTAAVESPAASASPATNGKDVTSPLVGTFYLSPAPGEPAFVKVGDKVSKGQTLCIVEAMKIMNEVEADISGELVEICVENEDLVEFGQVLFRVRP